MSVFVFIILIVGLVTCGEVVSKYLETQRAGRPALDPADRAEIERLREQMDALAARVDRLTEEQRFLTRLLEQRPGAARLPEGVEPEGPG